MIFIKNIILITQFIPPRKFHRLLILLTRSDSTNLYIIQLLKSLLLFLLFHSPGIYSEYSALRELIHDTPLSTVRVIKTLYDHGLDGKIKSTKSWSEDTTVSYTNASRNSRYANILVRHTFHRTPIILKINR